MKFWKGTLTKDYLQLELSSQVQHSIEKDFKR